VFYCPGIIVFLPAYCMILKWMSFSESAKERIVSVTNALIPSMSLLVVVSDTSIAKAISMGTKQSKQTYKMSLTIRTYYPLLYFFVKERTKYAQERAKYIEYRSGGPDREKLCQRSWAYGPRPSRPRTQFFHIRTKREPQKQTKTTHEKKPKAHNKTKQKRNNFFFLLQILLLKGSPVC